MKDRKKTKVWPTMLRLLQLSPLTQFLPLSQLLPLLWLAWLSSLSLWFFSIVMRAIARVMHYRFHQRGYLDVSRSLLLYFVLTFTPFNNGGLSPNNLKLYPYDRPTFELYFKIPCPKINYEFLLLLYVRIKELIMIFSFALCSLQYDHLRVTEPQAYI